MGRVVFIRRTPRSKFLRNEKPGTSDWSKRQGLFRGIREKHHIIAGLLSFELQERSKPVQSENPIPLIVDDNDPSVLVEESIHGNIMAFDLFQQWNQIRLNRANPFVAFFTRPQGCLRPITIARSALKDQGQQVRAVVRRCLFRSCKDAQLPESGVCRGFVVG